MSGALGRWIALVALAPAVVAALAIGLAIVVRDLWMVRTKR